YPTAGWRPGSRRPGCGWSSGGPCGRPSRPSRPAGAPCGWPGRAGDVPCANRRGRGWMEWQRQRQGSSRPIMTSTVHLEIPASGAYLAVVRAAATGLAAQLQFTYEEIDDLRIAVDEACTQL